MSIIFSDWENGSLDVADATISVNLDINEVIGFLVLPVQISRTFLFW